MYLGRVGEGIRRLQESMFSIVSVHLFTGGGGRGGRSGKSKWQIYGHCDLCTIKNVRSEIAFNKSLLFWTLIFVHNSVLAKWPDLPAISVHYET